MPYTEIELAYISSVLKEAAPGHTQIHKSCPVIREFRIQRETDSERYGFEEIRIFGYTCIVQEAEESSQKTETHVGALGN